MGISCGHPQARWGSGCLPEFLGDLCGKFQYHR